MAIKDKGFTISLIWNVVLVSAEKFRYSCLFLKSDEFTKV